MYENSGCHWNDPVSALTVEHMKSCYDASSWALRALGVRLDTACNTYCRGPSEFHNLLKPAGYFTYHHV